MIKIIQADSTISNSEFERAYEILIYAYAETEKEIWGLNYKRIDKSSFRDIVDKEEVFLAYIEDRVVGCVRLIKLNKNTYSFGLLAADFNEKGLGIGSKLVAKAEEKAKSLGAKQMKIEILKAKDIEVKSKKELHNWYTRLGYEFIKTESFVVLKPEEVEKSKKMVNFSVFNQYRKKIGE